MWNLNFGGEITLNDENSIPDPKVSTVYTLQRIPHIIDISITLHPIKFQTQGNTKSQFPSCLRIKSSFIKIPN